MNWNKEADAELMKLWNEGYSASQIATKLNIGATRNAVIGRVQRLKAKGAVLEERTNAPRSRKDLAPTPFRKPQSYVEQPRPQPKHAQRPLMKTMADIATGECRFPITIEEKHYFCGLPQKDSSSYCDNHHKVITQKGQPNEHSGNGWILRPRSGYR